MLRAIRHRLTYANVISTLALFVALGGTTYAVSNIGSRDIRNNSVRSVDLRNNDVRGRDVRRRSLSGSDVGENRLGGGAIKESTLGKVPTAGNADTVGGLTAERLKVSCPAFTTPVAGVCVEGVASAPQTWPSASVDCGNRDRRLVPYAILVDFLAGVREPAAGGEWAADVFESRAAPDRLDTLAVTTSTGSVSFHPVVSPLAKPYRCMAHSQN